MLKLSQILILVFLVFFSLSKCEVQSEIDINEELLHAIVITRHGDRTPTRIFPKTKSEWKEGLGQLTHIGMKQHFELGQKFHKRYIKQHKLLNETFYSSQVFIRSSPKERTLMSAQSFAAGMFKIEKEDFPLNFHPVPIYSVEKEKDYLLYAYKNCPKLKSELKNMKKNEEWKQMEKKHKKTLQFLSEILGEEISLKEVTTLLNLIRAEKIHKKLATEIPQHLEDELQHIAEWVYRRKFPSREMGRLGAGFLMDEIRDRLNNSIHLHERKLQIQQQFVLFSAHDGTLLALMSALDLKELDIPQYANHLAFELYYDKVDKKYHVKLFYNDKLITIPSCLEECHMDLFHEITDNSYHLDWVEKCNLTEEIKKEEQQENLKKECLTFDEIETREQYADYL